MSNKIPKKVYEAIEHLCGEIEAQVGGCDEDSDFDRLNTKRILLVRSWLNANDSSIKTCLNCKHAQALRYPDGSIQAKCWGKNQLTTITDASDICDNWTDRKSK